MVGLARLLVGLALFGSGIGVAQGQEFTPRSWDDATALATQLVNQLTTAEKLTLVRGVGEFGGACTGNLPPIPRLSLPSICMNDGPAGLRGLPSSSLSSISSFPAGITAASTFNRSLIRARGAALGEEWRMKGAHVFLGPAMDVMRSPEAGRLWESFGADGWMSGECAFETITGVQSAGVQAVAKHAILNSQEAYRFVSSSITSQKTLMEKYFLPFQRAIDAGVSGIMCSYQKVNGTYACADKGVVGEGGVLKGVGGHRGYVVSDWGATHGDAAGLANGGLDIEMPGDWILIGGAVYAGGLAGAVSSGQVSNTTLNGMIIRAFTPYYMLGQDSNFPPTNYNVNSASGNQNVNARSDAHTQLIRDIANAGAVLLKNANDALPLGNGIGHLAVVGLDAANQSSCALNACDGGTISVGWGSGTNSLAHLIPPITAIQSFLTTSSPTTTLITSISDDQKSAKKASMGADAALVFVNADSGEFQPIAVEWSTGDRIDNHLWHSGDDLINAVASVCNNTIVIMHVVGPTLVDAWIDNPNVTAVVLAGLPGEQSGPSIVDILWGKVNPSGRLPYTIAKQSSDWPTHTLEFSLSLTPVINYTEGLYTDYMYFDSAGAPSPRFEFGFGLSYSFVPTYSTLSIVSTGTNTYEVSVKVGNEGTRAGTEVAQLYLGFPEGSGEPVRQMRGFEAIWIESGAVESVVFPLSERDISVWDLVKGGFVRPGGTFSVYVGSSSRDLRLTGTF